MKRISKNVMALLVSAAISLSSLAGCAPADKTASESTEISAVSSSIEDPNAAEAAGVVEGTISPGEIVLARGENTITLNSTSVFPETIENDLESVLINYGWGECYPTSILRKDDHTLELTFDVENADEYMTDDNVSYIGSVFVSGADEYDTVTASFPITKPALSSEQTAARGASDITLEVTLENTSLADSIEASDIELYDAFTGMSVEDIKKESDSKLLLTFKGEVLSNDENDIPYVTGGIALKSGSTTSPLTAYGDIPLVTAEAFVQNMAFSGPHALTLTLLLDNCEWNDNISESQISLLGVFEDSYVEDISINEENPSVLYLVLHTYQEYCDGTAGIIFAEEATTAHKSLGVDIDFDEMGFFSEVETQSASNGKVTLKVTAKPHNLIMNYLPNPDELTLAGEFEDGNVDNVVENELGEIEFLISFPSESFAKLVGLNGAIILPLDSVSSEYANTDDFDAVIYVGKFKENAVLNETTQSINKTGSSKAILLGNDSSAFSWICNFAKDRLFDLASAGMSEIGSVLGGKIMSWLGFEDPVESKLSEILSELNELSNQINNVEQSIVKLIDAVETSAFKQQMRDIQHDVQTLKPRITGYLAALAELSSMDPEDERYQTELAAFANMINNAAGIDFHAETYSLGEKILSDAAGTSDGALKAHFDRVTTQYNWERQTYDERERFYLYSVGTYTQSAMLDSIALEYIVETAENNVTKSAAQAKLNELKAQIGKVAELADKYKVTRLSDEYDRNLRTGIVLNRNTESVTYNKNNRLISREDVYLKTNQKLYTGKSRYNEDMVSDGTVSIALDNLGFMTEAQANDIMKYSNKGSLKEELISAGFNIPDGSPNAVILSEVQVNKSFTRTGVSPTRYTYNTSYKTFEKSVNIVGIEYMSILSKSMYGDKMDFKKVNVLENYSGWRSDLTALKVTVAG